MVLLCLKLLLHSQKVSVLYYRICILVVHIIESMNINFRSLISSLSRNSNGNSIETIKPKE